MENIKENIYLFIDYSLFYISYLLCEKEIL